MKDKVLRLCKRLKKCTISDIVQFTEFDENVVKLMLTMMEQEELIQIHNDIITLAERKNKTAIDNKNLNLMLQHRTEEEKVLIIKGFCLQIPSHKLCKLVNIDDDCICNYYAIFRKMLYEKQYKELLNKFIIQPQMGRFRNLQ